MSQWKLAGSFVSPLVKARRHFIFVSRGSSSDNNLTLNSPGSKSAIVIARIDITRIASIFGASSGAAELAKASLCGKHLSLSNGDSETRTGRYRATITHIPRTLDERQRVQRVAWVNFEVLNDIQTQAQSTRQNHNHRRAAALGNDFGCVCVCECTHTRAHELVN